MFIDVLGKASIRRKTLYVNIIKDGNPSTKSTRHVKANVIARKENQNNQIDNNEVEDLIAKRASSVTNQLIVTKHSNPLKNHTGLHTLEGY
jgi:hypothetical protein